jgi:hypothetical protein
MILIVKNQRLLCSDGMLRSHAVFGNIRGCVKTYSSFGHARRRAQRIGAELAVIPDGVEVGANIYAVEPYVIKDNQRALVET